MVGDGLTASLLPGAALIGSGAASLSTRSGCAIIASVSSAFGCAVDPFIAVCGSAGFDLATNNLACANSAGVNSSRATITRTPSLVMGHNFFAQSWDMRIQPCQAGCPGNTPSCNANPHQAM